MGRIDESKVIYPCFLAFSIISSIFALHTCFMILKIQDLESFRTLVDAPFLQNLYFARIILQNLDYMNISILKILVSFLTSLRFINIVILLFVGYLWCAKEESYMKTRNNKWKSIIILYLGGILLSFIVLLWGFKISSVGAILALFKRICVVLALMHASIIIVSSIYFLKEIKEFYYERD